MTSPSLDLDDLRTALESAGCRCTPQRRAVYEALRRADGRHPSAEEVYQAVKVELPKISLATVYKALEALEASGLASRLPARDGTARFDARRDDHYHLRCLRTGRVEDLPTRFDPDLVAKLDAELADRLQEQGFRVTGYRLELVGFFSSEAIAGSKAEAT